MKAELTYTPIIPIISANEFMSFSTRIFVLCTLLLKRSQTPRPEKINMTECKKKDCEVVVVACSETESTKGLVVVKNGLIALRYLKLGMGRKSDSAFATTRKEPNTINKINKINPFLILFSALLIFWMNVQDIRNTVGMINEKPPRPNTKFRPGLSNKLVTKRNVTVNNGTLQNKKL